jgi:hypothetical protein
MVLKETVISLIRDSLMTNIELETAPRMKQDNPEQAMGTTECVSLSQSWSH